MAFDQSREVARVDLRRRLRSRSALITAIVAPLALAVVFGSLIGGGPAATFEIGVVAADGSTVAAAVASDLIGFVPDEADAEQSSVSFIETDSADASRSAVDDGDLDAALVMDSPAEDGEGVLAVTVVADPDKPIAAQIADSVASSVAADIERATLGTAAVASVDPSAFGSDIGDGALSIDRAIVSVDRPVGGQQLSPMAFYGAGMAMLLLFFTVGTPARAIIVDREQRTLDRMLAGKVAPASVLGGYVLSASLLALIGFVTVWWVTRVAFGANWGRSGPVLVLIIATVAAIAGVATFVGSLARTPRQADTYAAMVTFVFAFLGGNFVGPADTGEVLRRLKQTTPNGWALDGFVKLSADQAGIAELVPTLVALAAFAVVFGGIGLFRVQRSIAR